MSRLRPRVQIDCSKDGRCKPEFKEDVDINHVIKRFLKTGQMTGQFRAPGSGSQGDFSTAVDFKESMNLVKKEEDRFRTLPARVRDFFNNDPSNFLAFMADEKNLPKALELGLVARTPEMEAKRKEIAKAIADRKAAAEESLLDKLAEKMKGKVNPSQEG